MARRTLSTSDLYCRLHGCEPAGSSTRRGDSPTLDSLTHRLPELALAVGAELAHRRDGSELASCGREPSWALAREEHEGDEVAWATPDEAPQ